MIKKLSKPFGRLTFWLALTSIIFIACKHNARQQSINESLIVKWDLVSNSGGKESRATARFVFVNKGRDTINGTDWQLYFNQATIFPINQADSVKGKVEHINGDLYRFTPGPGFQLLPRDSVVIQYAYNGIMIKDGDCPAGVYIVFNNPDKTETAMLVKNLVIMPVKADKSVFPDSLMLSRVPSPSREFYRNELWNPESSAPSSGIIPTPLSAIAGTGFFEISSKTTVYFEKALLAEAEYFIETIEKQTGIKLLRKEGVPADAPRSIILRLTGEAIGGQQAESYRLDIKADKGIEITGSSKAGVFYGMQSLLNLFPYEAFSIKPPIIKVNEYRITDAPRFGFRGFLLDVSRNFQTKKAVLKLIDLLALYKINALNFRMTEDEGWRIEINGLPELTQVGARRGHTTDDAECLQPSFGSGPDAAAANNHGTGFYTREDFKEILKYANQRHIKIIPEICFPGHTRAAIKAMEARYRFYMRKGDQEAAEAFRLIDPEDKSVYYSAQLYKDDVVAVCKESVYKFYETVIKDLKAMYDEAGVAFTFLHTGGDEVANGAWTGSPQCATFLKAHPEITNPRLLQAYFFRRALDILTKYKLQAGGWEEVVLNKDAANNYVINKEFVDKNVIPYVWDNTGSNADLGYRIANAGYKVVLCNVTNLYFDLSYNLDPREPGLYWGGFEDVMDPFVLAPLDVYKSQIYDDYGDFSKQAAMQKGQEHLKPGNEKNILGLQAQLWTETVKGQAMMEYYILPKLFAYAEKAWAPAAAWEAENNPQSRITMIQNTWAAFVNRIGKQALPRIEYLFGGFNYRIPLPGAVILKDTLKANLSIPGLVLRYTTDGSEPNTHSTAYNRPVKINGPVKIRAFDGRGRGGRPMTIGASQ